MSLQAIQPDRLFDGTDILQDRVVVVEQGRVQAVLPAEEAPPYTRHYPHTLLVPGFIDVQVNGGGGILFNDDPTAAGLQAIAEAHRRFGTTTLLPTLISDSFETMTRAAEAVVQARQQGLPGIAGIHFEGPYLNAQRKGVHPERMVRPPDRDAVALLTSQTLGSVVVTIAPECVPAGFIRTLSDAGVRVSIGHSAATYAQANAALKEGATCFTHLFNAMSQLTAREPGVVGAALEDAGSYCGVIADGHHLHDASLRIALAAKPRGRLILVTDAMACVGTLQDTFQLGGQVVRVDQGRCQTADGTLAGSALDMGAAVRYMVEKLETPLAEALRMASLYPAEFLGLSSRIGRIRAGFEANFALLDDNLVVVDTWISETSGSSA